MNSEKIQFPEGFLWGAATASYQVEGGITNNWSVVSDPGAGMENGQPKILKKVPEAGSSADHYNRYEEDFDIAKSIGHTCSRISIEWARIEPEEGRFDEKEIAHYRSVLQTMRDRGLTPFVTFLHFTNPVWFEEKGGFLNEEAPKIFARYCEVVAKNLGDLCTNWATINEPNVYASNSYMRGQWPPFRKCPREMFKVLKNMAKAHIAAYDAVKAINPELEVGIVKDNINFTANWGLKMKILRKISDSFWNHYFLRKIKGKFDAIGLNYYFSKRFGGPVKGFEFPKSDMGWDLNPHGMYEVLLDLKRYNVPVYISEAGIADESDVMRADYIKGLVRATHSAIGNGVDIKAFMYWSLIDNYEWAFGYEKKFGLISFDLETKERTVRSSAYVYKEICENNGIV